MVNLKYLNLNNKMKKYKIMKIKLKYIKKDQNHIILLEEQKNKIHFKIF